MKSYAEANDIPWITFGKHDRKIEVMRPLLGAAERGGVSKVVAIGVAQEFQWVWDASEKPTSSGVPWFDYYRAERRTTCYYVYIFDAELGPGFIKICAYAPYPIKVWLNGHVFRGMIIHDCGRRMNGNHRHQSAYYMCHPKNGNRGRPDKYAGHVKAAYIREDLILDAVSGFYTDRVFGPHRRDHLATDLATVDDRESRQREADRDRFLRTLADLARRQNNIMRQAQDLEPDDPFAQGLRQTYNDLDAERRATLAALAEVDAAEQTTPARPSAADAGLLDALPYLTLKLAEAPEPLLRNQFEITNLTVQLHPDSDDVTITIRLPADELTHITHAAERITNTMPTALNVPPQQDRRSCADAVRAPGARLFEPL